MFSRNAFYFLVLLSFGMISCSSDSDLDQDELPFTFVFGAYWGECIGDCVHLFNYDGTTVLRDDMDGYFDKDRISFSPESNSAYLEASELLLSSIPALMIEQTDEMYGCPDCGDQGVYFIQLNNGNTTREWYLDPSIRQPIAPLTEEVPEEIMAYIDLVVEQINDLLF